MPGGKAESPSLFGGKLLRCPDSEVVAITGYRECAAHFPGLEPGSRPARRNGARPRLKAGEVREKYGPWYF